jgi:hypothetical protein
MAHPLDALVEGILDRAAREGLLDALPEIEDLLAPHRGPSATVTSGPEPGARSRAAVAGLSDLIERTRREMASLPGAQGKAVRAAEIADLRRRLAAELQALRSR